jgi:hypothetical protein
MARPMRLKESPTQSPTEMLDLAQFAFLDGAPAVLECVSLTGLSSGLVVRRWCNLSIRRAWVPSAGSRQEAASRLRRTDFSLRAGGGECGRE